MNRRISAVMVGAVALAVADCGDGSGGSNSATPAGDATDPPGQD